MGFWTDGWTDARSRARTQFRKMRFSKPLFANEIQKRGREELSRLLPCSHGVNSCCVSRRYRNYLLAPVGATRQDTYGCCEFHEKRNFLTGGGDFFVATPFRDAKSTDLKAKTVAIMERVSSCNPSFSVRRNRPILELWASGRTDGRPDAGTDAILKSAFFEISFRERNPKKQGSALPPSALPSTLLARSQSLLCCPTYLLAPVGATKQEIWPL